MDPYTKPIHSWSHSNYAGIHPEWTY